MALEFLLAARDPLGVGAEVEAEVHGAHDRLRVAPFLLAPLVEHLALVLPIVRADVGAVPSVRVLRGGPERALFAAPTDPDGNAGLQRLGVVRRLGDLEILSLKIRAPFLGRQEQTQHLRVLLEHVLTRTDRRKRESEGLRLDVVPAGAEPAIHPAVGQVVDGGERLGEQPGIAVRHAVDAAAQPDARRVHRRRGQRRDRLVAIHLPAARRRLLEVVGDGEPVEPPRVGELPQLAHLAQRAAHVTDVDSEFHGTLRGNTTLRVAPRAGKKAPMTSRPYHVYVLQGRGQRDYADCQAALAHVPARMTTLPFLGKEDEVIDRTRDADAIVVSSSPITRNVMSALEGLKTVVRTGVGYDVIDVPAATELGVIVVNIPDIWVREVANHALSLLLAWNRKIVTLDRQVHAGVWSGTVPGEQTGSLHGETVGIVGLGNIGSAFARRVAALEMKVIASAPYVPPARFAPRRVLLVARGGPGAAPLRRGSGARPDGTAPAQRGEPRGLRARRYTSTAMTSAEPVAFARGSPSRAQRN